LLAGIDSSANKPNPVVVRLTARLRFFKVICLLYTLVMNKKAKKRLKEAIQKDIAARTPANTGQGTPTSTKKLPESRSFTLRPDKKRG